MWCWSAEGALENSFACLGPDLQSWESDSVEESHSAAGLLLWQRHWRQGLRNGSTEVNSYLGKPLYRAQHCRGDLHGVEREWDSAGVLRSEVWWRMGQRDSVERQWDAQGRLAQETWWRAGRVEGRHAAWSGGVLRVEMFAHEDILHGVARRWGAAGELLQEIPYQQGQIVGAVKTYHSTGRLAAKILYSDGVRSGEARGWYADGRRHFVLPWRAGKREGESRVWHPNGRLAQLRHWRSDSLDGLCQSYDLKGKRIARAVFSRGNCVQGDCGLMSPPAEESASENVTHEMEPNAPALGVVPPSAAESPR